MFKNCFLVLFKKLGKYKIVKTPHKRGCYYIHVLLQNNKVLVLACNYFLNNFLKPH